MGLFRWDVSGHVPDGGKFVLIGAPHTSNWDFIFMLATMYIFRLKVNWMGKHTLFRQPLGVIFKALGGIAIDRDSPNGVVYQMAEQFRRSEQLVVVIGPSGTRKRTDYWKSGFYWIAHTAQVPILCGYLDYDRKMACLGLSFIPTGDIKKDMDRIRAFYEDVRGKYPELATRIRLKDEDI
jgi:1-acyl-sn-glycerol-3-phosphate acyltransferase